MGIKDSSLWAREILSFLETAKNGSINGTAEANAMKQSIIEMCGKHRLPEFFSAGVNPLFSKQGVHDCRKQKVNAVYVWAVGVKTVPLIKDQVVFDDYAREAGERF